MSTDTADATVAASEGHDDGHAHPTDKTFLRMALILAVITGVEVWWSYMPWWEGATGMTSVAETGGLVIMMVAKFVLIAGTFMHLKFDNKLLTRIFYAGMILAVLVYLAVLTTFEFWS